MKKFEAPKLEIIKLERNDIIATSAPTPPKPKTLGPEAKGPGLDWMLL